MNIYNGSNVVAKLNLTPNIEQQFMQAYGIGSNLQKFVDHTILHGMLPYSPFKTGNMRNKAIAATTIGDGELIWPGPYSQFLWFGKVMVDPETGSPFAQLGNIKVVIDRNLVYHGGVLTGAFWGTRSANDLGSQWTQETQEWLMVN